VNAGGDVRHRHEFIGFLEGMTLTKKLPTLADVANTGYSWLRITRRRYPVR